MPVFYKVLLILTASALVAACDRSPEADEELRLRLVRTLKILPLDGDARFEFSGTVDAARKAELSFSVPGRLKVLSMKEGDRVEKDQPLAQLDATDYEIQQESYRVEFDKADADFRRSEKLVEQGVISRSDFDQLKAQREAAHAALAAARQNVAYTTLKAPFGGRIATRHVENFEEVQATQAIYTLQDTDELTINVDVPESVMIRVREGAKPDVYAVFTQFPERRFPLTVREVSTRADVQTNTFAVSFAMPAVDDLNILPGMSVTVHATPDPRRLAGQATVYVPAYAVLEDNEGNFVYLVKRQGDNRGIVEKRPVLVGELSDAGLAVTGGLQVGDEMITAGMSKMSAGLEVRVSAEHGR